jgi:AAHS family 4-hydroxybenzoate transporter-like MFS transporter
MKTINDDAIQAAIDKRFSGYQFRVITLCFIVALFDGFDTQAVAFTGPAMIEAFGASVESLAPVLTAGIVGMTLGAMGLGMLGDRLGRRKALIICVTVFALPTLLTTLATSLEQIMFLRALAGFGMGGATPVLLALAAEYSPARHRAMVTTAILLALPAGAMSGGLLAAEVMPLWGWQSIYLIGGATPLLLLAALLLWLPDSLAFLSTRSGERNGRRMVAILAKISGERFAPASPRSPQAAPAKAPGGRLGQLLTGELRLTTFGVWSVYFFNWVAWFMLLSWLPTLLKQAGLSPAGAPYASVTVNAAFIVFAIPLSWFLPRINTIRILTVMFSAGIAIALLLSVAIPAQQWGVAFLLIALAGFGIGGQQLALNYLVVASYPAAVRSTAMGWAIGMGRMGAILGSAVGGLVLSRLGSAGFFWMLALPLAIACVSMLLIRHTSRHKPAPEAVGS